MLPYKVSGHKSLQAYHNTFSQNLAATASKIKNQDLNVKILKERIKESEGKFAKKNPYYSKNSNLLLKSVTSTYGKVPVPLSCKNRSSTPQNQASTDLKSTVRALDSLASVEKTRARPSSVTARTGKLVAAIEGIQTSRNLYLQKLEETKNKEIGLESGDKEPLPCGPADTKEMLTRL